MPFNGDRDGNGTIGHPDGTRPWRRVGPVCCDRHGRPLHSNASLRESHYISGAALTWISSYLTNRQASVYDAGTQLKSQ